MNRQEIAKFFYEFSKFGLHDKFLKILDSHQIKVVGEWPNNNLPNIENDKASTLLAKLEEKWLKLNV